jgi:predicted nucleotide-binding protein
MVNKIMNTFADAQSGPGADFPKHPLRIALRVATALEEKNSGNAMPPTDIAIALDKSPGSSDFRVLLSSSIKYSLTTGSYNQQKIAVTALGRDILEPTSDESRMQALFRAAFSPPLFKAIFDAYKGKKVPDAQFFQNALVRDFGVSKEQAQRCVAIFQDNAEYLGLVRQASTGKWLASEPAGVAIQESDAADDEASSPIPNGIEVRPTTPRSDADHAKGAKSAIFVGHGKNKVPLQQLEKFLSEYKIPHKVAIDEANKGRPISQKVADLMKECGAAIIIFTADEEFKDAAGHTLFRPSENAVFELGAASMLYDSRIVIFKEVGVTFPTNFRDIGYIEFEKDRLDAKVAELFRELIGFQLITVSVAMNG